MLSSAWHTDPRIESRNRNAILSEMTSLKPKLRWFQYSLRTLFVVVTLCAIPCSWFAVKMQEAKRERESAATIEELGGFVEWSEPLPQKWSRGVLGDGVFSHVIYVALGNAPVTDAWLEHLHGLSHLQTLWLDNTPVTDAGLEHLKGLSHLQAVGLKKAQVTDEGVKNLQQALPNCEIVR